MYVMAFIMLYIMIFTYDILSNFRRVEISITKTRRAYMLYTVVNIISYIYMSYAKQSNWPSSGKSHYFKPLTSRLL